MRIGIVTSSYPSHAEDSANAGVFVRDFAWQLSEAGHHVVVVSPQSVTPSPGQPFTTVRFPWPGSEKSLTHIDPRKPWNLLKLAALLISGVVTTMRVARRERLEHVLAMWAVPSGLLALAVRWVLRTPYSVWALGSDIWKIRNYPLGTFLLRRVLRGATHLYADGLVLAQDVTDICGRPCEFLPSSRVMPEPGDVQPAQLEPGYTHVLCVARWHPHKGVDVLLDSIGHLAPEVRAKLRVHVYGGGPDEAKLRATVDAGLSDTVTINGFIGRDSFMALLRAVTVLVVPSRIESIPLILTDAAQARCPVIATDVGDMGQLVRKYGLGTVVPSEDPPSMAAALTEATTAGVPFDPAGAELMVSELSLTRSVRRFLDNVGA